MKKKITKLRFTQPYFTSACLLLAACSVEATKSSATSCSSKIEKMHKTPPLLLCRHLHHRFSSSSAPSLPLKTLIPPPPFSHLLSFLSPFSTARFLRQTPDRTVQIAQSVSDHLLQPEPEPEPTTTHGELDEQPLPLYQRLDAHFSHIDFDRSLVHQVLTLSPSAGRKVLVFKDWLSKNPKAEKLDDLSFSFFVKYLGRNKDFKAIHELLVSGRGVVADKAFSVAVDRLACAGRPTQVIQFFENMERDYGFARDREKMSVVVSALCENGFTSHAERFVKKMANEFFPNEGICDALVRGWCGEGKLDEARRLVGEITRGGFEIGAPAYNSMLDCVCKLCRKKEPFMLQGEADKVLLEMDVKGVPRDVGTFNVLISNYCKIRKTEDAMKLFERMHEWGCSPNSTTYIVLIKSLYQAARISEGDEMIDRMKSAGFVKALDKQAYYGFIKILCGIERVEHAMEVFARMKKDGCQPGIKTYGLLIEKLATHGEANSANAVFREAVKQGVPVEPKVYKVNPRYVKKPKTKKKGKKRETLPEKMARKRKRLRKLRLSFVKKPRKGMRRAY